LKLILDASAVLVALPDEPDHDMAEELLVRLRGHCELVAPAMILFEVGHAIHRKHQRRAGANFEERTQFMSDMVESLRLASPLEVRIRRAGELSERFALSFYDAVYLDMAENNPDGLLITQDGKLREVAEQVLGKNRAFTWRSFEAWFGNQAA
jgi:predicted nucleic acid-binding protein